MAGSLPAGGDVRGTCGERPGGCPYMSQGVHTTRENRTTEQPVEAAAWQSQQVPPTIDLGRPSGG